MQDQDITTKGTASSQSGIGFWQLDDYDDQADTLDVVKQTNLVLRRRQPFSQADPSSLSETGWPPQQDLLINRSLPYHQRPLSRRADGFRNADEAQSESPETVYEPSPYIYLDHWQTDPFSAYPVDLPQHVLTEQLHQCNSSQSHPQPFFDVSAKTLLTIPAP